MSRDPRKLVMTISLAVSVAMLTGKSIAYFLTHSTAILSDAAESMVHWVATALAAWSLWYASRPPDENHPYGHGRVAYFSAGFEGALVLTAGAVVIFQGILGLIRGVELNRLGTGLTITGVLALVNLVLGASLIHVGKRSNSLILIANGTHVLMDMWTSFGAILGVGLVLLTGLTWLDPLAAVLLGVYILYGGGSIIQRSISGLMDELDGVTRDRLTNALSQAVSDDVVTDFHQLRGRRVNDEIWVEVHLLVSGDLKTIDAHARASRVEETIRAAFPEDRVHVTSHVEPADHEAVHPGGHPGTADPLGGPPPVLDEVSHLR